MCSLQVALHLDMLGKPVANAAARGSNEARLLLLQVRCYAVNTLHVQAQRTSAVRFPSAACGCTMHGLVLCLQAVNSCWGLYSCCSCFDSNLSLSSSYAMHLMQYIAAAQRRFCSLPLLLLLLLFRRIKATAGTAALVQQHSLNLKLLATKAAALCTSAHQPCHSGGMPEGL
jgi:hypothetical protein